MTAALYLLDPGGLVDAEVGAEILLDGSEGHHAATVARLPVGADLLLADNSGQVARCRVNSVSKGALLATVQDMTYQEAAEPRFTLIQALAKADRDLLAIEVATELGVDRVIPWQADRSVVRWRGEREIKAQRKWQNTLVAATKQARRPRVPTLETAADQAALLEHVQRAALSIVLHESAATPLASLGVTDLPIRGEVLLVVGPEGGISATELAALVQAGARSMRLGETVLRTSTAGSAAIALLSALGRWRA
ncbi:MAG: 16S rRNA (uracil(1498)-N(3))-methyltransferase [Ornithinimicrobium sp.]